jgi:zinc transport system substrate-binding protein
VVVTIPPIAEFVEQVGGSAIQVEVMVPPGASPHTHEPTPGQLEKVSEAALYVKVGSGIEFELTWMNDLLEMNRSMLVVDCSQDIQLISSGESNSYDPHIWLSPRNAQIMVHTICEGLITIDPDHETSYTANRDTYIEELKALDEQLTNIFSESTTKKIMVFHPAWTYFCRDYDLQQVPIEKEGKEPTPRGIQELIEQARRYEISVIVASPEFSTETAEVIAHEIGGKVILVSPLEKSYADMLYTFAQAFEEG